MNTIKESEARDKLFKSLESTSVEDLIYGAIQDLFMEKVNEVEADTLVTDDNGDDYTDYEAWYDETREDFFNEVYVKIARFIDRDC